MEMEEDSRGPICVCSAASGTRSPPFLVPSVLFGNGRPLSGTKLEANGASRNTAGFLTIEMNKHSKHVRLNPGQVDKHISLYITCTFGSHVSGEFAAHVVVVGADVVKAPIGELVGTVKLKPHDKNDFIIKINTHLVFLCV